MGFISVGEWLPTGAVTHVPCTMGQGQRRSDNLGTQICAFGQTEASIPLHNAVFGESGEIAGDRPMYRRD